MNALLRLLGSPSSERLHVPSDYHTGEGWAFGVDEGARRLNNLRAGVFYNRCWQPPDANPDVLRMMVIFFGYDEALDWNAFAKAFVPCLRHTAFGRREPTHALPNAINYDEVVYAFDDQIPLLEEPIGALRETHLVDASFSKPETRFEPSQELAAFLTRGIDAYVAHSRAREQLEKYAQAPAGQNMQYQFSIEFKRLISTVANRTRYGESKLQRLGESGRFHFEFQHMLLDNFMLVPDEITPFLQHLYLELAGYLQAGNLQRGSWGQVIFEEDALQLVLKPPSDDGEEWFQAERVE